MNEAQPSGYQTPPGTAMAQAPASSLGRRLLQRDHWFTIAVLELTCGGRKPSRVSDRRYANT